MKIHPIIVIFSLYVLYLIGDFYKTHQDHKLFNYALDNANLSMNKVFKCMMDNKMDSANYYMTETKIFTSIAKKFNY